MNLLVADSLGAVPESEVMRVLSPGGVAMIGGKKIVKPVPAEIDDWTHYLYKSANNAVSKDTTVGSPQGLQWVGGPRWAREAQRRTAAT